MNEKVCRLCLETIKENYQSIGHDLKNTLKLNLEIAKENVACTDCANNFQIFSNFKSACVYIKKSTLPLTIVKEDIKSDPVQTESSFNLNSRVESKSDSRCCFCIKFGERQSLTSLNESKENKFLVNMLKEYIPELNLITEDILTCGTCLEALQGVSRFIAKCSYVEEKINKYTNTEGADVNGQIELKNVQQFVFKPTVKFEFISCDGQIQEAGTSRADAALKLGLNVKREKVDVKLEQVDCNSFQELPSEIKMDSSPLKVSTPLSETKLTGGPLNQQLSTYKTPSNITMYKCEMCLFETRHERSVKQHVLIHKNDSEVTMYKCEKCSFKTKYNDALKRHVLIHKSPSEIQSYKYKCEKCSYETRHLQNLNEHNKSHMSLSEISTIKCAFQTVHKGRHKMYICEMCSHETNQKGNIRRHMLTHQSKGGVYMCDVCTYTSKYIGHYKRHIVTCHALHKQT